MNFTDLDSINISTEQLSDVSIESFNELEEGVKSLNMFEQSYNSLVVAYEELTSHELTELEAMENKVRVIRELKALGCSLEDLGMDEDEIFLDPSMEGLGDIIGKIGKSLKSGGKAVKDSLKNMFSSYISGIERRIADTKALITEIKNSDFEPVEFEMGGYAKKLGKDGQAPSNPSELVRAIQDFQAENAKIFDKWVKPIDVAVIDFRDHLAERELDVSKVSKSGFDLVNKFNFKNFVEYLGLDGSAKVGKNTYQAKEMMGTKAIRAFQPDYGDRPKDWSDIAKYIERGSEQWMMVAGGSSKYSSTKFSVKDKNELVSILEANVKLLEYSLTTIKGMVVQSFGDAMAQSQYNQDLEGAAAWKEYKNLPKDMSDKESRKVIMACRRLMFLSLNWIVHPNNGLIKHMNDVSVNVNSLVSKAM